MTTPDDDFDTDYLLVTAGLDTRVWGPMTRTEIADRLRMHAPRWALAIALRFGATWLLARYVRAYQTGRGSPSQCITVSGRRGRFVFQGLVTK